jgi:WhiB family redox-sensing transcriptional regulator
MSRYEWADRAACIGQPDTVFFPESGRPRNRNLAQSICAGCPVRIRCLRMALETEVAGRRFGIWGGLTPDQRARLAQRGAA